jgi:hypothetical protein
MPARRLGERSSTRAFYKVSQSYEATLGDRIFALPLREPFASHQHRLQVLCLSQCWWRNPSKSLRAGVSPMLPEKISRDHGRLAISKELSAAKTYSTTSLRPRGSLTLAALRQCLRIALS